MKIAAYIPFSTVDYPGEIVTTLFTKGCPWHCEYCHNAPLKTAPLKDYKEILKFLKRRSHYIPIVVISGGEPLYQKSLISSIEEIKKMGYKVGLHTSGMCYKTFKDVLPLLTWVGLDIKANRANYERVTGVKDSYQATYKCLKLLVNGDVGFEIRTTLPSWLTSHDMMDMAKELESSGIKEWILQRIQDSNFNYSELLTAAQTVLPKTVLR